MAGSWRYGSIEAAGRRPHQVDQNGDRAARIRRGCAWDRRRGRGAARGDREGSHFRGYGGDLTGRVRSEAHDMTSGPRALLRAMFDAAVAAALPEKSVPLHLPPPPKGSTV